MRPRTRIRTVSSLSALLLAAALLAPRAEAQPDDFEPDDAAAQASLLLPGSPQTHSIDPVGDEDWMRFTLLSDSGVRLETTGPSGDTRMWLRNAGRRLIEFDDDGGAGLFSLITRDCGVNELPAGDYFVQIDEFADNDKIASYDITLTLDVCDDAFEPDDDSGQATPLVVDKPQVHSIGAIGESDWMTFEIPVSAGIELETIGPIGDTRMWLRDSGLSTVEFDDDGGIGLFSFIDRECGVDALPPGTYFVEINDFADNDEIPRYEIELRLIEFCTPFAYAAGVWTDDSIHYLDSSLADVGEFPAGSDRPNGVATDGVTVWSGHFTTSEVIAYDILGNERFRWSGSLSGLQGMTLVDATLAIARSGNIDFHNRLTGSLLRTVPAPSCGGVEGIAYDGTVLWALCDTIEGINPFTGAPVRSLPSAASDCSFNGTGITASAPGVLTLACTNGDWFVVSSSDGGVIVSGNNGLDMYGLKSTVFTPEPGRLALFAASAACLAGLRLLSGRRAGGGRVG